MCARCSASEELAIRMSSMYPYTKSRPTENVINEMWKSLSCITKTKRHAQKLKQAKGSANGGLRNIIWVNRNLMICTDKVNLGENGFVME